MEREKERENIKKDPSEEKGKENKDKQKQTDPRGSLVEVYQFLEKRTHIQLGYSQHSSLSFIFIYQRIKETSNSKKRKEKKE